jgi:hypothetical protein
MADATRKIIAIDSRMSARDRKIVRMVCGQEHHVSDAVRETVKIEVEDILSKWGRLVVAA